MQNLPSTLTHAIVQQTISLSPDHGETLDFSHHNLSEVNEEEARDLANSQDEIGTFENSITRHILSLSTVFQVLNLVSE
jgi:hypothetical protein